MNHKPPNTKSITPANPPNTPPTIPPTFFPPAPLVVLTGRTLVVVDGSEGRGAEAVKVLHELLRNVVVWVVRTSIVEVPRVKNGNVPGTVLVTVVTTGEHAALADVPDPPPPEQGWVLVIVVTPGDKVDTTVDVNVEKLCVVATVVCVASEVEHAAAILVRVQKLECGESDETLQQGPSSGSTLIGNWNGSRKNVNGQDDVVPMNILSNR
ncbi:hypothetical protein K443DRAFT_310167 [Laccaria amethystina LaAM-08-1]|uniref:Uncharacterized protein n=1 Tax=Laccaria amethystina LaAM-08-1 TaxID=1095629 RepID=A0A0C9X1Z4_9AGAR|nr:hypothetical protein K443DRAFT_310167 [Laccaria amethystina LaAM-08-1]